VSDARVVARDSRTYWLLAAVLASLWLATLAARPLFNPDEGRYAEIPREMLSGGDWVIPHLNGLDYIEKPPLQYWATALCYRLLGTGEFAARLYSALSALATVGLIGLAARKLWNPDAAWRAAAVLGAMFMFVALGQLLTLDMSLTFYLTLSLVAFLLAQRSPRPGAWMLLAWTSAGAGVLTKGLVAAAIPTAVLILYSVYSRDFSPWRRLCVRWGLPLFLAVTVPWHWLAARRLPDFLQFFFVHEHVARYLTPSADRQEPWWFFIAVLAAGSMPWTVSAAWVLGTGWRRSAAPVSFNPILFLWIWVMFIGVFFSISDSKLMPYILPAMPALALLIGAQPAEVMQRAIPFTAVLTLVAGVGLGAASAYWPSLLAGSRHEAYFLPLAKHLLPVALLLAAAGAFVLLRGTRRAQVVSLPGTRDATRVCVLLGGAWCLAWLLLVRAASLVAPVYSGVDLAAAVPAADRDAPIYSVGTYDQTLTFYLRRSVTLVGYRGELDYGLRRAPSAYIAGVADFVQRWSPPARMFAVMEKAMFDDLRARGVPMRLIAENSAHVLVARQ